MKVVSGDYYYVLLFAGSQALSGLDATSVINSSMYELYLNSCVRITVHGYFQVVYLHEDGSASCLDPKPRQAVQTFPVALCTGPIKWHIQW